MYRHSDGTRIRHRIEFVQNEGKAVVSRSLGALLRAVLVMALVILPGAVIPGGADGTQFVALTALFCGLLVYIEYSSSSPIMVEFRDAKPYNELRFLVLTFLVMIATCTMYGITTAGPQFDYLHATGHWVAVNATIPFSPTDLMVRMLPDTASMATVNIFAATCALCFAFIVLVTLAILAVHFRSRGVLFSKNFNVHTNLPMFEPTSGGDVILRLRRDARLNVLFGVLLPFIIPACFQVFGHLIDPGIFTNLQSVVWIVSLWAFLSFNLLLRGLAMYGLVGLIEAKRRQRYAEMEDQGILA